MESQTQLHDIPNTCNGLFLWIERMKKSFDLRAVTAVNWAGSCKKLFSFDDPGWEEKDPSEMDLELLSNRAIKSGVKAVSVATYKVKCKEAIRNFAKFREHPSAYKPPAFKKRSHDLGAVEVLSLPGPTASSPATPPVEVKQGLSLDRHIHFHIHLSQ
jgi:hypothetical protein